ncbi:hypothetical protein D9M68_578780 [compost metagenome]
MHNHIKIRLNNMDLPAINGIDCVLVDIDTNNLELTRGKDGGGRQANIAQANDRNSLELHVYFFLS